MSAMPKMPSGYPLHAGGSPTPEQEALLRARFDGQVKTLRALGDETDVHWTVWRRWALELGLKNPADQQPPRRRRSPESRYMRPKRATIAAVPDELEPEEELDELEGDDGELYPTCPTCGYVLSECECETDSREPEPEHIQTPPPTPAPVTAMPPARMRPHRRDRSWDDRQFLAGYLDRLPATWTVEERERWLRAFVATVDLLVPIEPGATAKEGV